MDTKNFLSDEEQKHFDKYLADFEANDRSLVEEYNKENKYISVAKNKNIIIGVIGITAILSLIGIGKSFVNMNNPKAPVVAETPQPAPMIETNSVDNEIIEENDEMNQKELEELKKNFKPFGNEIKEEMPAINNSPLPNHENNPTITPPIINHNNNIPASTEIQPYNQLPTEDPIGEQIYLKGFSKEGDTTSCYIALNNSTGKYTVGDKIGRYTIQSIQSNYVMLVDEKGNQKALVK